MHNVPSASSDEFLDVDMPDADDAIQRGYADMLQGRIRPWAEAKKLADSIRTTNQNDARRPCTTQQECPPAYNEEPLTAKEIEELHEGYAQTMRGECLDAYEMLAEIRARYRI